MPAALWRTLLDSMAGWLVLSVVVGVALTVGCYAGGARAKRIKRPHDVFSSYTPMAWLVLAVLPAATLFAAYAYYFELSFPGAKVSWVGGATSIAAVGGLATLVVSYVATWLPLVTPRKFKYRPRAPFVAGRAERARTGGATQGDGS
jgi:vacuolar-type H+-ATPase subunit I/STV1